MIRFLTRRLLQGAATFVIVATLIFMVLRAGPGDPTAYIIDPTFPDSVRESLLNSFGLDQPLGSQYVSYMANLLQGDLGVSFFSRQPVLRALAPRIVNTLILGAAGLAVSYPIAILAGVVMASRRRTKVDSVGLTATTIVRAAPEFWIAMLSVTLFSFYLGWFPGSGIRSIGSRPEGLLETFISVDFLYHLTLPALTAGVAFVALPLLVTRNSMLEVLKEDYVEFARSKGFTERRVLFRHGLRNALIPVATEATVSLGLLMGSLVVLEAVFSWPGVGQQMVLAVIRKDFPMAQGAFLIMATGVIMMNMLADVVYGFLDPRIVYKREAV